MGPKKVKRGKKKVKKVIHQDEEVEFVCTVQAGADLRDTEHVQDPKETVQDQDPEETLQEQVPEEAEGVPEQALPTDVPEEQHNAEEPQGELELGTDQEPVDGRSRKRKRGPTKMKDLAKDPNTRVHVDFNSLGEPYGEGSVKLSSYLGPLVREHVLSHLKVGKSLQTK